MFTDVANDQADVYQFSTLKSVRDSLPNPLSPPLLRTSSQDFNRDGLPERWNISLRIRKPTPTSALTHLNLVVDFDYRTQDVIKTYMDTLAIVQLEIPNSEISPVRSIKTVGSL